MSKAKRKKINPVRKLERGSPIRKSKDRNVFSNGVKKPRLPIEAVLRLKGAHVHEPKKGKRGYSRKAEKKVVRDIKVVKDIIDELES